ncbi:MAG TPA: hypothetical protein VF669_10850 [Tepidisphaeraceae bacterium]
MVASEQNSLRYYAALGVFLTLSGVMCYQLIAASNGVDGMSASDVTYMQAMHPTLGKSGDLAAVDREP